MKRITFLFFMLVNLLSFAQINDSLNLLKEEDKKIIAQKIKEIESKKNLHTYVNTMQIGEGFKVSDPERTVILNIKKEPNIEKYEVELSFSKDMEIEEKTEELDAIIDACEEVLEQKEFHKYVIAVLDGVSLTIEDVNITESGVYKLSQEDATTNNERILQAIVLIILAFLCIAFVESMKKKKKKKNKNKVKNYSPNQVTKLDKHEAKHHDNHHEVPKNYHIKK